MGLSGIESISTFYVPDSVIWKYHYIYISAADRDYSTELSGEDQIKSLNTSQTFHVVDFSLWRDEAIERGTEKKKDCNVLKRISFCAAVCFNILQITWIRPKLSVWTNIFSNITWKMAGKLFNRYHGYLPEHYLLWSIHMDKNRIAIVHVMYIRPHVDKSTRL